MTTPTTERVVGLPQLEVGARVFADARAEVARLAALMNDEISEVKRRHQAAVIAALRHYADSEQGLRADVTSAPDSLFVRPRTYQMHGIKIGRQKGRGGLRLQFDDAQTVALIRKHFASQADALIVVKERPAREALENLPAKDLKRLGIEIIDAGDEIVCKAVDTDIDRLIRTLTQNLAEEMQ